MLCVFEGMSVRVNVFDLLSSNSLVILNLHPLFNRYGEQRSQRYCFKQGWWKQATRKRLCCDLNHHIRCWRIYTRNFVNAPTARQSSGGFWPSLNVAAKQPLNALSGETGCPSDGPNSLHFHQLCQTAGRRLGEAIRPIATLQMPCSSVTWKYQGRGFDSSFEKKKK